MDPSDSSIWVFRPDRQPIAMTGDEQLWVPDFMALDWTVA